MFNMSGIKLEEEVFWCTSDRIKSAFESTTILYKEAVNSRVPTGLVNSRSIQIKYLQFSLMQKKSDAHAFLC